jgi:hypothetical protein
MVRGEMEMPMWGLVSWRTLALGRNGSGNGSGDDDTGHNEGALLGCDMTRMQMKMPYLQRGRISEGVFGGERKNLMRKEQP